MKIIYNKQGKRVHYTVAQRMREAQNFKPVSQVVTTGHGNQIKVYQSNPHIN